MAADTSPPELRCSGLAKTFPGGVEAVRPLDAVFEAGRTTALVGPSGCGKSTILRMIAGLEPPSGGEVTIGGAPPAEIRRRAGLAIAFQDASLLPWRTVRGNIRLALRLAHKPADADAVDRLIRLVGLEGFADTRPAALSGGMRQRAAIARCLVTGPELLLLDEPFGAVDELTRRQLAEDLPRIWQARGTTTLLVTHSVTEAILLSDRVLVFSPRPAALVADIAVDLPQPRSVAMTASADFLDLAQTVSGALARGIAEAPDTLAAQ
ncbi:NitT/TauT family transport system ATP-binding protein [Rhodovulum iodosum]|uniref:NitT/TauT family transport system ATP-binding protein n=1 Tax=Rhodovulum iodosum TaxID=68291 RepID=A0ABV3XR34_9RHOB|nr:ABC transporter ATP-binding protein [Rhodovulum robiginosum]RSK32808.1 ABC transporter ATP-binding protein [Rhodovulum robiginosum]